MDTRLNDKIEKILLEYRNCNDKAEKSDLEQKIVSIALNPLIEEFLERYEDVEDRDMLESCVGLSLLKAIRAYDPINYKETAFLKYFTAIFKNELKQQPIFSASGCMLTNTKLYAAQSGKRYMDSSYITTGKYPTVLDMANKFGVTVKESYNLFFAPYENLRQPFVEDEVPDGTSIINLHDEAELFVQDDTLANRNIYEKTIKMLNKKYTNREPAPQKAGATLLIVYKLLCLQKAFDSVDLFKNIVGTLNKVDDNVKRYTKEIVLFIKENKIRLPLKENDKQKIEAFVESNNRITYLESPRQIGDLVACRNAFIFGVFTQFLSHESVSKERSKYVMSFEKLGKAFDLSRQRIFEVVKSCALAYFKHKTNKTLE